MKFIEWRYYEGIEYYFDWRSIQLTLISRHLLRLLIISIRINDDSWQYAYDNRGFDWIDALANEQSIISFVRHGRKP